MLRENWLRSFAFSFRRSCPTRLHSSVQSTSEEAGMWTRTHSSRGWLVCGTVDDAERDADHLATDVAIPETAWRESPASRLRSRSAVEHLARQLRISSAIVAGRIRRQYNDYRVLNELVGHHTVRQLFPEVA